MTCGTNGIKFKSLVTSELEKAFLSSFVYDWEWLESFLGKAKVCFAIHSRESKSILKINNDRVAVFPRLEQYGCMHVKLLLLWYPGYMRFVLPSANLIPLDWESMENVVYYQDFPRNDQRNQSISEKSNSFYPELSKLLLEMGVPTSIIDALKCVDFSKAKGNLVASIPGRFSDQHLYEYGCTRLMKIIQNISPGLDSDQEVYYQVFFFLIKV